MELLPLFLRAVLLSLSFFGLCATARSTLKLNRFIAPCFVACSIICVLMFGGMLHVLKYAFFLLYFGGFAGLIYTCLVRRIKPDLLLIGLFFLFTGYLAWRFSGSELFISDDFSHWGTAARYLVANDAFPDDSAPYIFFQSYPLGATAFIYYISNTLGNREEIWLVAQNLLQLMLILPVFAFIRKKHLRIMPVISALFLLIFKFNRPLATLTVDWLLAFFGFGVAAAALYYKDNLRKAAVATLPGIVAVVYTKSSGAFFAAVLIVILTLLAGRSGRKKAVQVFVLSALVMAAAMFAWNLHVKLSFAAGSQSKHAVSAVAYMQKLRLKGLAGCLSIGWKMIRMWLFPEFYQVFSVIFLAACVLTVYLICRRRPELHVLQGRVFLQLSGCILCYAVWFLMLYFMYILSMPASEANRLASFTRYDSTGVLLMVGLALVIMLDFLNRIDYRPGRFAVRFCALLVVVLLATAPMLSLGREYGIYNYFYHDLASGIEKADPMRTCLRTIRANHNLADQSSYIVYCDTKDGKHPPAYEYYAALFELNAFNLHFLYRSSDDDAAFIYGDTRSQKPVASISEFLSGHLSDYDALIILNEDPEFESGLSAALESYDGSTAVIRHSS